MASTSKSPQNSENSNDSNEVWLYVYDRPARKNEINEELYKAPHLSIVVHGREFEFGEVGPRWLFRVSVRETCFLLCSFQEVSLFYLYNIFSCRMTTRVAQI